MTESNNLPRVGRKVEVNGLGTLLCESSGNGAVSFVGRYNDGIVAYSLPRDAVISTDAGVHFTQEPARKSYDFSSGGRYNQLDRMLRSARM